jgi:cation diffusion facilitator CzcD-associated flavoprotein CzcO
MAEEHYDVLIVGAGLSGIGAGYHLEIRCPGRTYTILEGRDDIGGTWDLFRYPGIRSDSDMYTLGYSFRPWTNPKAIADGPSILEYVKDTARTYGIDRKIRFRQHVKRASWSSVDAQWTVEAERTDTRELVRYRCNFLFMCSGYYNYAHGHTPEFAGVGRFRGRIVHPQFWTNDIDYADKRVVVIGSGATAVTLVPELSTKASHVTMLQRSPTYIVSAPETDSLANFLRENFSARFAYAVARWRNVLGGMLFYWFCQRRPERAKALLLRGVKQSLGDDFDARDFTPSYRPWNQRLCLVPNGDLFEAIKAKRVSVLTDTIDTLTENGIRLSSGRELEADLIVTATGLELQVLSDLAITVDGRRIDPAETMAYKGMMLSGVPNLAMSMGYTNASWTLKCDLTCEYVCRLLSHMDRHGYRQCVPVLNDPTMARLPMIDFSSGYVTRSIAKFPKQGARAPWRLYQNYLLDVLTLRFAPLEDGVIAFSSPDSAEGVAEAAR